MILLFELLKLCLAGWAIYLGVAADPIWLDDQVERVPRLDSALLTFGIALASHDAFFHTRGLYKAIQQASAKQRRQRLVHGICDFMNGKLGGSETAHTRFALSGEEQMVRWLVSVSGVVLGLVAFEAAAVPTIELIGAGALVASVMSGIVYMNVLAGGISSETEHEIAIEGFNSQLAVILLNIAYWSFVWGVVAIFFALLALGSTEEAPGG